MYEVSSVVGPTWGAGKAVCIPALAPALLVPLPYRVCGRGGVRGGVRVGSMKPAKPESEVEQIQTVSAVLWNRRLWLCRFHCTCESEIKVLLK